MKFMSFVICALVVVNTSVRSNDPVLMRQKSGPPVKPHSAALGRWYTFNSPDRDFTITFPVKPAREPDSEAPSGTMRTYVVYVDSVSYSLAYVDIGVEPNSIEGNQLPQNFRRTMLEDAREKGWVVARSILLRKNVYEQETWSPTKRDPNQRLHYIERNIVRHGRQYVLSCASLIPEQKVSHEPCRRFMESFRVIREPQPQ